MALYSMFIDVARSGRGHLEFAEAARASRRERWYEFLELPAADDWLWDYYRPIGNFDNLPYWEKITVPVLLVYGERDRLLPAGESLRRIEGALRRAGNRDYTAVLIPRAAHNLTVTPEPGEPFEWWRTAPGLNDLLTAWVSLRFAAGVGSERGR
jgi:pimeloyl-ACP methyl ester carboxylesterase